MTNCVNGINSIRRGHPPYYPLDILFYICLLDIRFDVWYNPAPIIKP
ncbi:hypothetical protein BCPG1_196 [Bacillus phage BCPG1]|nr:hypothetical protein BCPG1_196 [Bacillus phage BCPG1]